MARHAGHHARGRLSRHGRVARQRLARRPADGFLCRERRARRRRVPEDVSIIGFDELSLGAVSNPPLTTVHVPKHEVGEIAVRRLVGNIRNPKSYTCKTAVSTYFVERQSVREI